MSPSRFLATLLVATALPLAAQSPKRPAITGVAFARFYTTDTPAAEHFYGSTLGFPKLTEGTTLVYPVNRAQWIELLPTTPPTPDSRLAAVGFTTRDAPALERYLTAHGVAIEVPLHNGEFSVRDPEGNLVVFIQTGANKAVAHAPAAPTAPSTRMIHVGFLVRDRAKEDTFWRDLLGFTMYWSGGQTDTRTDYVAQQVPDGTDWLEYMLDADPHPTRAQMGGMDHISLGVPHMDDAITALARNQCAGPNCTKSQLGRDGKVQLNLFDPDLTRVEYMEFTPVGKVCCSPIAGRAPGLVENE